MSIRFDRWAAIVFLLIGTGFVVESRNISKTAFGSSVGPDLFPLGLGILLMLFSARLLYETFKSSHYKQAAAASKAGGAEDASAQPDYKRFLLIYGAAVLYAFFIEDIGYIIGTFLFLLFAFQVMERGKWIRTIIISFLFSFIVYYVFVKILFGTLPGFPEWLPIPL